MKPAIYNYQTTVRGDTIRQVSFTYTINSTAADIIDAKMQIRSDKNAVLATLSPVVNENTVTIPSIDSTVTKTFPIGKLNYDIETTLSGGLKRTYVQGKIEIIEDYTRV